MFLAFAQMFVSKIYNFLRKLLLVFFAAASCSTRTETEGGASSTQITPQEIDFTDTKNDLILINIAKKIVSMEQVTALSKVLLNDANFVTKNREDGVEDSRQLAWKVLRQWVKKKSPEATGKRLLQVLNDPLVRAVKIAEEFAEQLVPTPGKSFFAFSLFAPRACASRCQTKGAATRAHKAMQAHMHTLSNDVQVAKQYTR